LEQRLGSVLKPQLAAFQQEEPGYLGIIADDRQENGRGVRIVEAVPGSPGEQGGLRTRDLITSVDGRPVRSMADLGQVLVGSLVGRKLDFLIERDGQALRVPVTLGRRPAEDERRFPTFGKIPDANAGAPATGSRVYLGVRTQNIADTDRLRLRLPTVLGALVVSVRENSPAASAGLQADDVIVAVDNEVVNGPEDLQQAVLAHQAGDEVRVSLFRSGRFARLPLRLGDLAAAPVPNTQLPGSEELPLPARPLPATNPAPIPPQPQGLQPQPVVPPQPVIPPQPNANNPPVIAPAPGATPPLVAAPLAGVLTERERLERLEILLMDLDRRMRVLEEHLLRGANGGQPAVPSAQGQPGPGQPGPQLNPPLPNGANPNNGPAPNSGGPNEAPPPDPFTPRADSVPT